MITNMLTPKFSEEGTNAEKFEKKIYTFFLKYLREAASKELFCPFYSLMQC